MKNLLLCLLALAIVGCSSTPPAVPPKNPPAGGAPPAARAEQDFCIEKPSSATILGCPVWVGRTCWVNAEWLESMHAGTTPDVPITLYKDADITFCTNKTDSNEFIVIGEFQKVDCSNPAHVIDAHPHPAPFPAFASAHAWKQNTGKHSVAAKACFKTNLVRQNGTKVDPHIIISPNSGPSLQ